MKLAMLSKSSPKKKFIPVLRMTAAILFLPIFLPAQTIPFTEINFLFAAVRLSLPGISSITKGDGGSLYELTPLFAKDKTVFRWGTWLFSASEFHPLMDLLSVVSPPQVSMSFDDLLKGVAQ